LKKGVGGERLIKTEGMVEEQWGKQEWRSWKEKSHKTGAGEGPSWKGKNLHKEGDED